MPLLNSIDGKVGAVDRYLVANDFTEYIEMQDHVDAIYKDQARWNKMSILSVAGSGFFSSDRTIQQYADRVWKSSPCAVPTHSIKVSKLDPSRAAA